MLGSGDEDDVLDALAGMETGSNRLPVICGHRAFTSGKLPSTVMACRPTFSVKRALPSSRK